MRHEKTVSESRIWTPLGALGRGWNRKKTISTLPIAKSKDLYLPTLQTISKALVGQCKSSFGIKHLPTASHRMFWNQKSSCFTRVMYADFCNTQTKKSCYPSKAIWNSTYDHMIW